MHTRLRSPLLLVAATGAFATSIAVGQGSVGFFTPQQVDAGRAAYGEQIGRASCRERV